MEPEYVAHENSSHARVACVACHVGPGADWYVRSKLSGLYQVYAVVTDVYPQPIPTPIENLRPARAVCEQCHWPQKFYAYQYRVQSHYLPQPENPRWDIGLTLKVGAPHAATGYREGIHWHINPQVRMEYYPASENRQDIVWVRYTNLQTGEVKVFTQNGRGRKRRGRRGCGRWTASTATTAPRTLPLAEPVRRRRHGRGEHPRRSAGDQGWRCSCAGQPIRTGQAALAALQAGIEKPFRESAAGMGEPPGGGCPGGQRAAGSLCAQHLSLMNAAGAPIRRTSATWNFPAASAAQQPPQHRRRGNDPYGLRPVPRHQQPGNAGEDAARPSRPVAGV